jgi:chromosome segregation ATPase
MLTDKHDDHAPTELVLRHERELSQLITVTSELDKQNRSIIEGIEELKTSLVDIRIIKESISDIPTLRERLVEVNTTMRDINDNIVDLKRELTEKEKRIAILEDSTSHLGWLNKSIKVSIDKVGTIVVAGFLALAASHWGAVEKLLSIFKG